MDKKLKEKELDSKLQELSSELDKWDRRLKIALHLIVIIYSVVFSLILLNARQIINPIFHLNINDKVRPLLSFLIFYAINFIIAFVGKKAYRPEIEVAERFIEQIPIIGAIKVFVDKLGKMAVSNTITLMLLSYFGL